MTDCTCNHFPANLDPVVFDTRVGIGIADPGKTLDVVGDIRASGKYFVADGYAGGPGFTFINDDNTGFYWKANDVMAAVANGQEALMCSGQTGVGTFAIGNIVPANEKLLITGSGSMDFMRVSGANDEAGDVFIIKRNGSVGIGTADPQAKLDIKDDGGLTISGSNFDDGVRIKRDLDTGLAHFIVKQGAPYSGVRFIFGGTERVVFEGGGNVGIGTISPSEKLDVNGNAHISGNVEAANNVKVYDSGWFAISALGDAWKDHGLQTIPKGVTVLCAASASPSEVSVAGPSVAHWHNWAKQGSPNDKGDDIGAFVRMTPTQVYVRAGDRVGWHSGAWQASGQYKIIAWA